MVSESVDNVNRFFFIAPLSQVSLTVEVRGKAGNYLKQTISLGQLEKVGLM